MIGSVFGLLNGTSHIPLIQHHQYPHILIRLNIVYCKINNVYFNRLKFQVKSTMYLNGIVKIDRGAMNASVCVFDSNAFNPD